MLKHDDLWKIKLAQIQAAGKRGISQVSLASIPTFAKQSDALKAAASSQPRSLVLALQISKEARQYCVVDDFEHFYSGYALLDPACRHYYEVLEQDWPCSLYFDIEFYYKDQDDNCGSVDEEEMMMDEFKAFVMQQLQEAYPGQDMSIQEIIDLDCTIPGIKFSRHLIFHLKHAAFKNNLFAGEFVRFMVWKARGCSKRPLWFKRNEKGNVEPFVDLCVYSRNRNIRLFLSCKRGKDQVFVMAKGNSPDIMALSSREQLRHSLISVNRSGCLLQNVETLLDNPLSLDSSFNTHTTFLPTNLPFIIPASESSNPDTQAFEYISAWLKQISGVSRGFLKTSPTLPSSPSSSSSDRYVKFYVMGGNRFCERIGRQHKSNNIYFVFDRAEMRFRQGCFDADCRNYYFQWHSIPTSNTDDNDEWMDAWDDESRWMDLVI